MAGHKRRFGWSHDPAAIARLVGNFAVGAVMLGIMGLTVYETHAEVEDLRRQWNIGGPPCATATPALDPAGHFATEITYVGVDYAFDRAGVFCADVPDRTLLAPATHQVCQFNNPRFVRVRAPGEAGQTVFDIPPMQQATVIVRGGRAACVLAGWFR